MRNRLLVLVASILLFESTLFAQLPKVREQTAAPMSPPAVELRGSDESQRWQNYMADIDGLERIQNRKELLALIKSGALVPLPQAGKVRVDQRLRRTPEYCHTRPWTRKFLKDLAAQFPGFFFQVNSAVRDATRQRKLARSNANAAAVSGPKASSHLTGSTVDITKRGMASWQVEWMRNKLLELAQRRVIWVTEEFNQSVFHIMVFKAYGVELEDSTKKVQSKPAKKMVKKHQIKRKKKK